MNYFENIRRLVVKVGTSTLTHENGKLTLFYYSADDLQRIWEVLEMAKEG